MDDRQVTWVYWNHFLYLEELLSSSEKHVSFVDNNFSTTSVTFMHIILAACADIECILKEALLLQAADGIKEIGQKLKGEHNEFCEIKILVPALKSEKQPWIALKNKEKAVPSWWLSYNDIKHNKNSEPYRGASLEHAISALAGLFSVNLAYYSKKVGKDFSQDISLPKFFNYPGLEANYRVTDDSFNINVPGFAQKFRTRM